MRTLYFFDIHNDFIECCGAYSEVYVFADDATKSTDIYTYIKIGSVCPSVCTTVSASINPYPAATDCAAATDISGGSGRWQLSR